MSADFCYLPILRAKQGEFEAVRALSPDARSRLVPLFDVPDPVPKDGPSLDDYLAKCAQGIHRAWDPARATYVDAHDLALNLRTASGAQPIDFLFNLLRMHGSKAIPVTGTEAERGRKYLAAVREVVARDHMGACLRLAEDDIAEPRVLTASIVNLLEFLAIGPPELDVVLDFRFLGNRNPDSLRAIALEALQAIDRVGQLRNIVVAGSGVPDMRRQQDASKVRREPRVEFDLWTQITTTLSDRVSIAFGDYGVIYAYFTSPDKPVRPPARIRYTTLREYVFYRGKRNEYPELCKQLVASGDFADENSSEGDRKFRRRATGISGPGNPTGWVAADTNHHLELVSAQAWRFLDEAGMSGRFALPAPVRQPWLQPDLA